MVRIKLEKKDLTDPCAILAQVASMKSKGGAPTENSCINFTPTTLSMINSNAENAVAVEHVPFTVVEGDINTLLDTGIMLNTKKLASIVKAAKKEVNMSIDLENGQVKFQSGRSSYSMDLYTIDKQRALDILLMELHLFDYNIEVKQLLKLMAYCNSVTANAVGVSYLGGTLFDKNNSYSTDRVTGVHIKDNPLFASAPETLQDVLISTDLFVNCISKSSEEFATPGITANGSKIALRLGNITLYKTIMSDKFPKNKFVDAITRVKGTDEKFLVKAIVNTKEFISKLKEHHGIVESETYSLGITKDKITFSSSNQKIGSGGNSEVDATEVLIPEMVGESITGLFEIEPLLFIGELFGDDDTIELRSSIGQVDNVYVLNFLSVENKELFFFCTPKSA